jgi:hypothetical protein
MKKIFAAHELVVVLTGFEMQEHCTNRNASHLRVFSPAKHFLAKK